MGKTNQCCSEADKFWPKKYDNIAACVTKVVQITKIFLERTMHGMKIDEKREKEVGSSRHDREVLLSRFRRKRMRYNFFDVSEAGRDKIAQSENNLEEYRFLLKGNGLSIFS